jgi:hypothetical protein
MRRIIVAVAALLVLIAPGCKDEPKQEAAKQKDIQQTVAEAVEKERARAAAEQLRVKVAEQEKALVEKRQADEQRKAIEDAAKNEAAAKLQQEKLLYSSFEEFAAGTHAGLKKLYELTRELPTNLREFMVTSRALSGDIHVPSARRQTC